jgi:dipeptidyl aminopeptidase
VDPRRIGIWGWVRIDFLWSWWIANTGVVQSYGGFMSAKVVEADAGIHSLAMSVAVSIFFL